MATPPATRPETWTPAGSEATSPATAPPQAGPASRRRPGAGTAEPASRTPKRPRSRKPLRAHLTSALRAAVAAGVPWAWFLVRDLGPPMQLIALALPVLVAAATLGLVVATIDDRRLVTAVAAVSVAAFGWVAIAGPRGAQPAPAPRAPVRVASMILPGAPGETPTTLSSITRSRIDVAIVVARSKKARASLVRAVHGRIALQSGRFLVLSSLPVHVLPVPRSLPRDSILRFRVDRPGGSFVVYAVDAGGSVLGEAMDDPLRLDALEAAAHGERLPVVLTGDFGMSDRSSGYRSLAASFRDAARAGGGASSTLASLPWSALFLRTEYLLTSPSWCAAGARTIPVPGSQQPGVTASVGPCSR